MTILKTKYRAEYAGKTSGWNREDYAYASIDMSGAKGQWKCYEHNGDTEFKALVDCPHEAWDLDSYHGSISMTEDLKGKLTKVVIQYNRDQKDYQKDYPSGPLDHDVAAEAVKCISTPTKDEYTAAFADLQRHHDVLIAAAQGVKDVADRTESITNLLLDADGSGNLDFPEPYTVLDMSLAESVLTDQTESEYMANIARGSYTGYTGEAMLKSPVQKGDGSIGLYPMRFPPEEGVSYSGIGANDHIREGIAYSGVWGSDSEADYDFQGTMEESQQALAVDLLGGSADTLSIAYSISGYQPKEFRPIFYSDTAPSLIGSRGDLAFIYPDFPLEMVAADAPMGYLVQNTRQPAIATQMMLGRDAAVEYRNMIGYALDAHPDAETAHDSLLAPLNQYIDAMQAWIDAVQVIDCWHRMVKWDLSDQAKKAAAWVELKNKYDEPVDEDKFGARIAALTLEAATVDLSEIGLNSLGWYPLMEYAILRVSADPPSRSTARACWDSSIVPWKS